MMPAERQRKEVIDGCTDVESCSCGCFSSNTDWMSENADAVERVVRMLADQVCAAGASKRAQRTMGCLDREISALVREFGLD